MEPTSEYLVGSDAIDLAKLTGLQLHRGSTRASDTPDTSWQVAEQLVMQGVDQSEFYMDLGRLSNSEASHSILSLIGLIKAFAEFEC